MPVTIGLYEIALIGSAAVAASTAAGLDASTVSEGVQLASALYDAFNEGPDEGGLWYAAAEFLADAFDFSLGGA